MDCTGLEEKGAKLVFFLFICSAETTITLLYLKNFEDMHKLWFVLYKERNLLLSEREKARRAQRPITSAEENRYTKVKRSMAAIKVTMTERAKIDQLLGVRRPRIPDSDK